MKTLTKEMQENLSPKDAHNILLEGNKRFSMNLKAQRNLQDQVFETSKGQYPFAVVLSCIDSRVPAELVFDQGIGDIFSIRIAGNIINEDVLGSMEYACKVSGSKIIVVLGHTKCGAVNAACENVNLGNITPLLKKIKPAIKKLGYGDTKIGEQATEMVGIYNVENSIDRIRTESPILKQMEESGEIEIIGGVYSVESGKVDFFDT